MLIDWFTVGAQAVNFLILVWLMKRFLYKPILDAIDAREKKIAQTLADAVHDLELSAQYVVARIPTGRNPQQLALSPDGAIAAVAASANARRSERGIP